MTQNSNKTEQHYAAGDLIGRGDLTRALIELLQVPEPERDDDWHKAERLIRATLNEALTKVREDLTIFVYPIDEGER